MTLNSKGFTLLETMIVVSVLLITVGVAGDLVISLVRGQNKSKVLGEIEQNGNYALARISYDLKNARSVSISSGPSTQIIIADQNNVSIRYRFTSSSNSGVLGCVIGTSGCTGVLTRTIGEGAEVPMTNYDSVAGVNVVSTNNASYFEELSVSPPIVRVYMTIKQGVATVNALNKSTQASEVFDTSVVLLSTNQ